MTYLDAAHTARTFAKRYRRLPQKWERWSLEQLLAVEGVLYDAALVELHVHDALVMTDFLAGAAVAYDDHLCYERLACEVSRVITDLDPMGEA